MPDHSETEDINDDLLVSSKRAAPIDQRQLADEATKRRKDLPLLQRIVKYSSTSSGSNTRAKIAWSAPSSKAPSRISMGRPQGHLRGHRPAEEPVPASLGCAPGRQQIAGLVHPRQRVRRAEAAHRTKDTPQLFPADSDSVIQVSKDQIRTKSPRILIWQAGSNLALMRQEASNLASAF
jgi:hypothetical protein